MDENILPTTILPYETKALMGIVPFNRTDAFLGRPDAGLSLRGRAWMLRRARRRSWTCVHLDQFADLWALQPLADSDLDASALRHAAVSCCLQHTDVHKCLGSADQGDKPKPLLGIEPFDDCFDRLRCLRRARPWTARPPFGYSIGGGVIVIVTVALWFTVSFVAAHLTSVRIRNKRQYLALSADSVNRPPSERSVHPTLIHNRGGAQSPRSPAAEKINPSYVSRVLRLTLLTPGIVEAIPDGRQPADMSLAVLMRSFAVAWTEQRKPLIGCLPRSPARLDAVA
jgi:hypothetical protein